MTNTSKTRSIPIRVSADLINRLDRAAGSLGTNRSGLLRLCAETFVEHFEKEGSIQMPVNWQKLLISHDGRKRPRST